MALTVENGTGLSNADSYLSVADADTYWTDHGNPSTWSGATTATKEEALRMGTQYLDLQYGTMWPGRRVQLEQALDWPRYGVTDYDDISVDSDEVPTQIQHATAEAALRHITETGGLLPDVSEPGAVLSENVKVGPIAIATEYAGGRGELKQFTKIDAILSTIVPTAGLRITSQRMFRA